MSTLARTSAPIGVTILTLVPGWVCNTRWTSRVECAAACGPQSEAPSTYVSLLEVAFWPNLPDLTSSSHGTLTLKSEPEEDLPDDYLIDIAGLYEKATS